MNSEILSKISIFISGQSFATKAANKKNLRVIFVIKSPLCFIATILGKEPFSSQKLYRGGPKIPNCQSFEGSNSLSLGIKRDIFAPPPPLIAAAIYVKKRKFQTPSTGGDIQPSAFYVWFVCHQSFFYQMVPCLILFIFVENVYIKIANLTSCGLTKNHLLHTIPKIRNELTKPNIIFFLKRCPRVSKNGIMKKFHSCSKK